MKTSIILICLLFVGILQAQTVLPITGDDLEVDVYGRMVVLDGVKNTLRLFSAEGVLLKEVGGGGWGENQFDYPRGVWARNGIDVFVADYGNHRIQRFDRTLNFVGSLTTRDNEAEKARFGYPTSVALSRQGELLLCDGENVRIVNVSGFSTVQRTFGGFDAGAGRLYKPGNVDIGPDDVVYVADGGRVMVFDAFGGFLQQLGVFQSDVKVIADMNAVVVMSSDTMTVFDGNNRHAGTVPMSSIVSTSVRVMDIAFSLGKAYVLTDQGVVIVADPWDSILQDMKTPKSEQ